MGYLIAMTFAARTAVFNIETRAYRNSDQDFDADLWKTFAALHKLVHSQNPFSVESDDPGHDMRRDHHECRQLKRERQHGLNA